MGKGTISDEPWEQRGKGPQIRGERSQIQWCLQASHGMKPWMESISHSVQAHLPLNLMEEDPGFAGKILGVKKQIWGLQSYLHIPRSKTH